MDGNSDFAKLTSFVASYEKYVKAFTQMPFPGKEFLFCPNIAAAPGAKPTTRSDSPNPLISRL
jgi:hypothetical protein